MSTSSEEDCRPYRMHTVHFYSGVGQRDQSCLRAREASIKVFNKLPRLLS
jgi:hypothetical protein